MSTPTPEELNQDTKNRKFRNAGGRCFYVQDELWDIIITTAERDGMNVSQWIVDACEEKLKRINDHIIGTVG